MTSQSSRRSFLGLSALGLAAAVAPNELIGPAAAMTGLGNETSKTNLDQGPDKIGREISIWVTSGEERFAAAPGITWRPVSGAPGTDQLKLNPLQKFQDILGFGGAFTDAACYTFNRLSPPAREQLFHELFHPSEMGLSIGRVCLGSSDYSTKLYSYDDGEADPDLKRFSIEHDREYILPVLRQARQENPDLFLFSTPWSPPGWMKFNGSMLGGSMRNYYFPVYAQYYLKFLQSYAAEGVPVQALTTQNEVDTDQDGRMPACIWGQEYEIQFIRDHLGPLLESAGRPVKIWLLDHNYNLWGRVVDSLEDDKLRKYVDGVAWHGYYGTPNMMTKVHDAYPKTEMHWTEGGPDYTDPGYLNDWCKWGGIFSDALRNWCRSITAWNLALDEHGKPNIGPFPCGGVVTIDSQTKEITRSGEYWALAHYSRVIRRGARRFDSQSSAVALQHVALENPDGQQVLVVTNPGPARKIELRLADMAASVPLKATSVTTLAWR
ncbi:MAG: glycoside hydrolase family 30 beta sandwich domain-containing protein [Candidatus Sulfotelmatobacter sp.]|jgi:glucosylceramidase